MYIGSYIHTAGQCLIQLTAIIMQSSLQSNPPMHAHHPFVHILAFWLLYSGLARVGRLWGSALRRHAFPFWWGRPGRNQGIAASPTV